MGLAFDELAGWWMPVLKSSEVGEKPVSLVVSGVRLALFRGTDGVGAVLDRCPHRSVRLSLGEVEGNCLVCPFHGWQFDKQGACQHVPYNPEVDRRRMGVEALPVVEKSGMIWVFLGERADRELVLPPLLERPEARLTVIYDDWDTHWTRAMENMLDVPHLPFVHGGTIGREMKGKLSRETRLDLKVTETEAGFDIAFAQEGQPPGKLQWGRPNEMVLHLMDTKRRTLKLHVWCVPMETGRTRLIVAAELEFGVLTGLVARMSWTNRKIIFEDKEVVSSSGPERVPHPRDEKNVPTDLPTLKFRAWYLGLIEKRRVDVGSVASVEVPAVGAVAHAK